MAREKLFHLRFLFRYDSISTGARFRTLCPALRTNGKIPGDTYRDNMTRSERCARRRYYGSAELCANHKAGKRRERLRKGALREEGRVEDRSSKPRLAVKPT